MTRLKWLLFLFLRYYRNLGLRVALYAGLALVLAFISPLAAARVDDWVPLDLTFDSVLPVLTILASSMLAVSTFSLNIMVSAHRAAADATTPRVHRILLENTTTQSVLATFIGAFVYSLTSIILYRSGFYADNAALLIMGVTILVALFVVISLLRWIDLLKDLGSVDESIRLAKSRANTVLSSYASYPNFGAAALTQDTIVPTDVSLLLAPASGVLQLINIAQLADAMPETSAIYIQAHPGRHFLEGEMLAQVSGNVGPELIEELTEAFTIGDDRTHEQDTEFGLNVLAEIALRALSPGINDPGTAIQTVTALKEVLWAYGETSPASDGHPSTNVFVRFPSEADLVNAAFAAIARDGAATVEVACALRRTLQALCASANCDLAQAAYYQADLAMAYSEKAGLLAHEIDNLKRIPIALAEFPKAS